MVDELMQNVPQWWPWKRSPRQICTNPTETDAYYTDFPIYNPYLEQLPSSPKMNSKLMSNNVMRNNYKYYDVDGLGAIPEKVSKALKMYHYTTICKHISAFFTQFSPFQLIYEKKTEWKTEIKFSYNRTFFFRLFRAE